MVIVVPGRELALPRVYGMRIELREVSQCSCLVHPRCVGEECTPVA